MVPRGNWNGLSMFKVLGLADYPHFRHHNDDQSAFSLLFKPLAYFRYCGLKVSQANRTEVNHTFMIIHAFLIRRFPGDIIVPNIDFHYYQLSRRV